MAKTSRPSATENLMLLLALVPYVIDRGEVSVAEAARQFSRSEADITEAVRLIACAGVPGENLAYSHLDLFDIDWDLFENEGTITFWNTVALDHSPRFSAREASALIAGLQYLAAHPAYSGRTDLDTVLGKIKRGSSEGFAEKIAVSRPGVDSHVHALNDAITSQVSVDIVYHNKAGESGSRRIDPLVLESRDSRWYVRAWCHHRKALRTFRLDHIQALEPTDVAQLNHDSLIDDISPDLFQPSANDITVTIECQTSALPLIADYVPRGFIPPRDQDRVVLDIAFAHYGSLTRFVGKHSNVVRVLGPASAVAAISEFATQALANYQSG
jgi:proteasome accessory factor C